MSEQIKAIRFHEYGGSEKLVLETIPRPVPKANEVLIKVHFAGVNPIDWKLRAGYLKDFMPLQLPFVPGIDVSGTIEEIGSEVKTLKKGQAVFGVAKGAYAEYAIALASDVTAKPESLSFELAATLPVGALTAWQTVEDAGPKTGQTVVVMGAAGGVGLFAVQFARMKGARVIGIASSANLDFVKSLGAEKSLDYNKGSLEAEIKNVDIVIDTVGGETLEKSYDLLKKGGMLVTMAGQISEEKAQAHGVKAVSSRRGPTEKLKTIGEMVASKTLRAEVGRTFPLSEAGAAQDLSQTRHGRGRIVLRVRL
ncbi:MAG: NADP-dependent oxidoreductase [Spirochaetia bacterium]|jgi:NADPH:quinone reductase-like Zn-dependent oxidoreductase